MSTTGRVETIVQHSDITEKKDERIQPSSLRLDDIDKVKLWKILQETQCPLKPGEYETKGKYIVPYYFNHEFWVKHDKFEGQCRPITFDNDAKGNKKRQAMDHIELMLVVDNYIGNHRINRSYELADKMRVAKLESQGFDDGDDSNDAVQLLIPTFIDRCMFLFGIFIAMLNGYFIVLSIQEAMDKQFGTEFANTAVLALSICEVILYTNLLFSRIMVDFGYMLFTGCRSMVVQEQCKNIGTEIRNISSISLLKYLPSVEDVFTLLFNPKIILSRMWVNLYMKRFELRNQRFIGCIFAIPVMFIDIFGPILALFAVIVKANQIGNATAGRPFLDWDFNQCVSFFAVLNQASDTGILTIQQFIFSNGDGEMDIDEASIVDDWWNISLLSVFSNLRLSTFDSMVLWYRLDAKRVTIMLTNGATSHEDSFGGILDDIRENDSILDDYDKHVLKRMND